MVGVLERLERLRAAADLVEGRIPDALAGKVDDVLARSNRRLAVGPQTVVALAGATGSGKSSLFNALTGTRLAEQGPRRPTTATTLAASFTATNADLLDFLEVPRRHEVAPPEPDMTDLVLLDLPDHDSTATAHREEVDRLVRVVDQFVWVLDPQKYADAALHQRYLRPLAEHREVITVVLNQADRLTAAELSQCLAHIRRLLDDDGLTGVPLLATSAVTGEGVADLRRHLSRLAAGKRAASARLAADVTVLAAELDRHVGPARGSGADRRVVDDLTRRLAGAAGVPVVVDAVRDSVRHRGTLATGWPVVSWLAKLRPDPLQRLGLGRRPELESPGLRHSSLPARSAAAHSQLSSALRAVTAELGADLPGPWRDAVAAGVREAEPTLGDRLDRAIVETELPADRSPAWWTLVRVIQWLLIAVVVVGLGWLTLNAVLGYFGLGVLPMFPLGPEDGLRVPVPTLLVAGGVVAGLLVSGLSRLVISAAAGAAARRARKRLESAVAEVAEERVLAPARAEVARHDAARAALDRLR